MRLNNYDFEEIGEWYLYERVKSGINFHIIRDERVIYAFVVNGKVKYIGICEKDTTMFRGRLERYKYCEGSGTNERIAEEIKRCLEKGKNVKIYALRPIVECVYKDLNVDLVKGLENPLIRKFRPEWNIL